MTKGHTYTTGYQFVYKRSLLWPTDSINISSHEWRTFISHVIFLYCELCLFCRSLLVSCYCRSHLHLWPRDPCVDNRGRESTSCPCDRACYRTPIFSVVTVAASKASPACWVPAYTKRENTVWNQTSIFALRYASCVERKRVRCECDCPLWGSSCLFRSQFQFTI